jgi:hypothetical protein
VNNEVRVAMWSVSKNRLVGEMETTVRPTAQSGLFMAQTGSRFVPVWLAEECLDLRLDECYKHVWFTK